LYIGSFVSGSFILRYTMSVIQYQFHFPLYMVSFTLSVMHWQLYMVGFTIRFTLGGFTAVFILHADVAGGVPVVRFRMSGYLCTQQRSCIHFQAICSSYVISGWCYFLYGSVRYTFPCLLSPSLYFTSLLLIYIHNLLLLFGEGCWEVYLEVSITF